MKTEHEVIAVSVMFGLLVWIIDAVMDYLFFYEGTLLELLITDVPPHEIYIRSLTILFFLIFGIIVLRFITKRKHAEDALQRERDFAENLIATAQIIVLVLDTKGRIVHFNPYMEAISGYRLEEVQGRDWFTTFLPKRDQDWVRELFLKAVGDIRTHGNVNPIVTKDGREREIEWYCKTLKDVKDADGNTVGLFAVGQDVTERKAAEARIDHLNSVLKAIRNVNQLIVIEKDRDCLLKKACDILVEARGYEAAWLGYLSDGETFGRVVGSGFREDVDRFCESVMDGNHPACIKKSLAGKEIIMVTDKSGECGDCSFKDAYAGKETAVIRIEREGKLFGLLAISLAADVTFGDEEEELLSEVASDIALALHNMDMEEARKSAEDQIKASLKEKEVLLREIHHRVKNNLQVVSSLLDMQARGSSNKDTIDALTESKDRLNAMALIHAQLYEGSDLSEINMNGFVNRLLVQLLQSYPVQDTKITPIVSVADYPFPISVAVPVGLILNELLSNALKHAFVDRNEGTIEVSLTASEEGKINLIVSDDGAGLPDGFDINATGTLGLRLVKILTEDQLRGSLEVISKEGATFNMEFDTKY